MFEAFRTLAYRAIGGHLGAMIALDVPPCLAAWATHHLHTRASARTPKRSRGGLIIRAWGKSPARGGTAALRAWQRAQGAVFHRTPPGTDPGGQQETETPWPVRTEPK